MKEYMEGFNIGCKHGLSVEIAHLKHIRESILFDLDKAKKCYSDCEDEVGKAFNKGRISAHNYILNIVEQILNKKEKEESK